MVDFGSHPPRALIALDGPELDLAERSLAALGVATDRAPTSTEVAEALAQRRYDVLLLDAVLADGGSGYDVLAQVRSSPATRDAPVLLFTSPERDSLSIVRGLHAGAADYVPKPVAPATLCERLLRALGAARSSAAPRTAGGAVLARTDLAGATVEVVEDSSGRTSAFLLDASAHGTAASLVTRALRAELRSRLEAGRELHDCIVTLERAASAMANDLVPQVALGVLRFASDGRHVEWVGAGLPPLLVVEGGDVREIASAAAPLGLGSEAPAVQTLAASVGATFVISNDGLGASALGPRGSERFRSMVERYGVALARASATELRALVIENAELTGDRIDEAALVVAAVTR